MTNKYNEGLWSRFSGVIGLQFITRFWLHDNTDKLTVYPYYESEALHDDIVLLAGQVAEEQDD